MRLEKPRAGARQLDGRPATARRSSPRPKLAVKLPSPRPPASFVAVDYPRAGENVVSRGYTIRLSVRSGGGAEVSIDDEAWQPCREAAGHWWYDWSGDGRGGHKVCARVTLPDGRRSLSECRSFIVDLP